MRHTITVIRKSDTYKYVYLFRLLGREGEKMMWGAKLSSTMTGKNHTLCYETEREAAITVDKKLIEAGKKPVNILRPKQP